MDHSPAGPGRILFHVDMDAFYASIEEQRRPELRGIPVVVGADPQSGRGRGVVCTANYPARAFGIRSAMPISQAWRACPDAVFLRPDFGHYAATSGRVMAVLQRYADILEVIGMDEAYLDVTQRCGGDWDLARSLARSLQAAVRRELGLSCSVGVAPTKSCAKVASDFRKPHGVTLVRPEAVAAFLGPLPVRRLHGCGPKTAALLGDADIRTVAELAMAEPSMLRQRFGAHGDWLARVARGDDDRPVCGDWGPAKSRGNESTFQRDEPDARRVLRAAGRLLDELLEGRDRRPFSTLTVKVRYRGFETVTRSHTVEVPLSDGHPGRRAQAHAVVAALLTPLLTGRPIRLVGVRLSGFSSDSPQAALSRYGLVGNLSTGPLWRALPQPKAGGVLAQSKIDCECT